ncbi:MAG TPA: PaaX family transcriptional regulator C-terminal domain-containing protein [Polyangiales bacterium]|nr:PaaX family transcriptional regulator C-terminal domain-containing protein [Polyangiales bacterium]
MPRPKTRPNRAPKARKHAPERTWLRPQSVVFTLLAEHVLDRDWAVFSGSFIDVLSRIGVGEHAVRSTLSRMTRRGLLEREKRGRKIYLRMTPRCIAVLEEGRRRIWEAGAVNVSLGERWTLLTFSLPDAWRRKRYDLRARLGWSGFGPLQNGAWLAPAEVDVRPIVEHLGLTAHVRAFHIQPVAPTDASSVIRETFDLDALAARYRAFIADWEPLSGQAQPDALALTLRLSTQWLRIIREDPRVPVHLLPADWPAIAAQRLFRLLHAAHREPSQALARGLLETIES